MIRRNILPQRFSRLGGSVVKDNDVMNVMYELKRSTMLTEQEITDFLSTCPASASGVLYFYKSLARFPSFNESCLIRDYGADLVIIFMNRLKPSFNA